MRISRRNWSVVDQIALQHCPHQWPPRRCRPSPDPGPRDLSPQPAAARDVTGRRPRRRMGFADVAGLRDCEFDGLGFVGVGFVFPGHCDGGVHGLRIAAGAV